MKRWLLLGMMAFASLPAWARDTVAVLYFDYSGSDESMAPLKVGLAQMMITDLTAHTEYDVVERTRLQAILDELKLGHSGVADPSSAAKIGKLLGAKYMVMGSYFYFEGVFMVHAKLVDVETSLVVSAAQDNGQRQDFMRLEKSASAAMHAALTSQAAPSPAPAPPSVPGPTGKVREATPAPAAEAAAIVAPDAAAVDAAVAFSDGLIFLDAGDKPKARESFEKAIAKSEALTDAKAALASLDL